MSYYFDETMIGVEAVLDRIVATDLIPSRKPLLNNIDLHFFKFSTLGITTLHDLRKRLKTTRKIENLSFESCISLKYLTLLKREIDGYIPNRIGVTSYTWIDPAVRKEVKDRGYMTAEELFNAHKNKMISERDFTSFSREFERLYSQISLTRIQWVSAPVSRMLYEAGYTTVESVQNSDPQTLFKKLDEANERCRISKVKISLKDVKRLVVAAHYIGSDWEGMNNENE